MANPSVRVQSEAWKSEYNALSDEERAIVDALADGILLFAARGRALRDEYNSLAKFVGGESPGENVTASGPDTGEALSLCPIGLSGGRKSRVRRQKPRQCSIATNE